jgi:hypothetical protein
MRRVKHESSADRRHLGNDTPEVAAIVELREAWREANNFNYAVEFVFFSRDTDAPRKGHHHRS